MTQKYHKIKGWNRLQEYSPDDWLSYMKFTEPLHDNERMYHVKIHCTAFPDGRELILIMDNDYDEKCARLQWADLPRIAKHWKVLNYEDIASLDRFCEVTLGYVYQYQSDYFIGVDQADPSVSSFDSWTKFIDEYAKDTPFIENEYKLWES